MRRVLFTVIFCIIALVGMTVNIVSEEGEIRDFIILHYNESIMLLVKGDLKNALSTLDECVIGQDKTFPLAYLLRGEINSLLKNHVEAIKDIENFFANQSSDWYDYLGLDEGKMLANKVFALYIRGSSAFEINGFGIAISDFTELISIKKKCDECLLPGEMASIYLKRGIMRHYLSDIGGAEEDYLVSIEYEKEYLWPYVQLYIIYSTVKKDMDKSIWALENMLSIDKEFTLFTLKERPPDDWLYNSPEFKKLFPEYKRPQPKRERDKIIPFTDERPVIQPGPVRGMYFFCI